MATLLSHFWRADDPLEIIEANARDWCDVLEHLPRDAIQRACVRYLTECTGRKPTPGDIVALARDVLQPPRVVRLAPPPEPPRERVSADAAERIMREIGFRPKRMVGDGDAD